MAKSQATGIQELRQEMIGAFLLRRLRELGLKHVFGVAGDFNLEFLEQLEADAGLKWIGCCNELNAAYAADGHARTAGLSALVTTYGVGELSALCGVAGAYAEHLSVIHITGVPPIAEIERHSLLHHTMGDGEYDNMLECARQFSVAQARITPENAVYEIDRCLRACLLEKRPVYLQLPSDISSVQIQAPATPLRVTAASDQDMLQDFTHAAVLKLQAASSVAILVDADVARFGQSARALELAEHLGCGVAVMGTAKGVVDETSPHYLGVYSGAFSRPEVRSAVEDAECLLLLGVRFIDSTTGSFSQKIQPERTIEINAWRSRVYPDDFEGLFLGDALAALIDAAEPRATKLSVKPAPAQQENEQSPETPLSQAWFWRRMERFYAPGDVILADNGTSLSGVSASSLPARSSVISQVLWAAIGYSLPACFGSLLAAPERRHLLFIGDGSFQLTAQELSSILRHKLTPIIFLINNDGYTIERLILGENSSYNDIQPWKYAALGNVFAAGAPFESRRVTTVGEMEDALQQAEQGGRCFFIEAIMPRMDAPAGLKKLGPVYSRQDYGESWER